MHEKNIITAGKEPEKNSKALIMLHGRGGSAEDILTLASHLETDDFSLIAPQATNHTWYPYSFMAPAEENEPWLSSAIDLLKEITEDLKKEGIPSDRIYFLGFSQGACLALEFVARNAEKYGGVAAYIGGLIGEEIRRKNYQGDFERTPVFIATANPDFHVPVERVFATSNILKEMGADVTLKVYENAGHNILPDHIHQTNKLIFHPNT